MLWSTDWMHFKQFHLLYSLFWYFESVFMWNWNVSYLIFIFRPVQQEAYTLLLMLLTLADYNDQGVTFWSFGTKQRASIWKEKVTQWGTNQEVITLPLSSYCLTLCKVNAAFLVRIITGKLELIFSIFQFIFSVYIHNLQKKSR